MHELEPNVINEPSSFELYILHFIYINRARAELVHAKKFTSPSSSSEFKARNKLELYIYKQTELEL